LEKVNDKYPEKKILVILGHLARNDPGFPGKVPVSTCNLVENFFKKSIFLSGKVTGSPSTSPRKKNKNY
jgi:hypothetical protein